MFNIHELIINTFYKKKFKSIYLTNTLQLLFIIIYCLNMLPIFIHALYNTSPLEWSCNITSLISVILAARNHVLTWLFGIISCILFSYFFIQAKLYAEAILQIFFIATSLWGWWYWSNKPNQPATPIKIMPIKQIGIALCIIIISGIIYAMGLYRFTDAVSPWIDSQILALSILAQWWLMQRQMATWPLWLIVNTLSVPLYFSREFYISSLFYSIYWVMAIFAYINWRKEFLEQINSH